MLGWFVVAVGGIGMVLVQFLLVVLFSAILYASGETAAEATRRFARRVAGRHGERSARLAAQATRGVALGITVTALVQACLAGIGLPVVGVPFATVLTAPVFGLCRCPVGPPPLP